MAHGMHLEPLCLWPFPHLNIGTSWTQFQGAGLGTSLAALSYSLIKDTFSKSGLGYLKQINKTHFNLNMYFKSHSAVGRLVGLNALFNTDESALKS